MQAPAMAEASALRNSKAISNQLNAMANSAIRFARVPTAPCSSQSLKTLPKRALASNFALSLGEARPKAQAASSRKTVVGTKGSTAPIPAATRLK
jgi:hypothetical protein